MPVIMSKIAPFSEKIKQEEEEEKKLFKEVSSSA